MAKLFAVHEIQIVKQPHDRNMVTKNALFFRCTAYVGYSWSKATNMAAADPLDSDETRGYNSTRQ